MEGLEQVWRDARWAVFDEAVRALARSLARVACTRIVLDGSRGLGELLRKLPLRLVQVLRAAGGEPGRDDATTAAQRELLARLDADVRASTAELLELHGLSGQAEGEILARVAQQIDISARIDEGRAAVFGGMLTGALAGLKADLASGGLTMGGGLLAGGVLGALGAAGVARGINVMRGGGPAWAGWSSDAMAPIVEATLLRYLAVAHFGRGRGDWAHGEPPPHWQPLVRQVLQGRQPALGALWKKRGSAIEAEAEAGQLAQTLAPILADALVEVLQRLYPDAGLGQR
jgi:hypothetical protein